MRFRPGIILGALVLLPTCGGEPGPEPPAARSEAELREEIDAFLQQRRVQSERNLAGRVGLLVEQIEGVRKQLAEGGAQGELAERLQGGVADCAERASTLQPRVAELGQLDAQAWEQAHDRLVSDLRQLEGAVDGLERELGG